MSYSLVDLRRRKNIMTLDQEVLVEKNELLYPGSLYFD